MGVEATGETPSLTEVSVGGAQETLECTKPTHLGISTRRAQFACG